MAKCSTNKTKRNLNSLIEFYPLINKTRLGQTAKESVEFLDNATEYIQKVKTPEGNFYGLKDSLLTLRHTVTKVLNPNSKNEKTNSSELGNFIHAAYEDIFKEVIKDPEEFKKNLSNIKSKYLAGENGFKLVSRQFDDIVESVEIQLKKANSIQEAINKRSGTKEKLIIRVEQKIVDIDYPDGGIGGTIDILFVFSNNTAMIADVKTSQYQITDSKMINKHQPQLSMYKKILIKSYGFDDVIVTDVIPVLVKLKPGSKTIKNFTVLTSKTDNEKVAIKTGEFNKTGYKELDKFVKAQQNLIQTLTQKQKSEKDKTKKEEYSKQIAKLKESIKHFLDKQDLDSYIEYIKTILVPRVNQRLTDGFYDKIDSQNERLADLENVIDELEIYTNMSEMFVDFAENTLTKEEFAVFEKTINNIQGWAKRRYLKLSQLRTQIALPGIDLGPMKELNFAEKYLTRTSDVDNPIFKAASNKILEMERKKDIDLRRIMDKFEDLNAKAKLWAKNNNISAKQLVSMLINEKGLYHNKLSNEATSEIRQAWEKKSSDKLKEIYEIKDTWKENYDNRFKRKKDSLEREYPNNHTAVELELKEFEKAFNLLTSNDAWTNGLNRGNIKLKDSFVNKNLSEEYKKIQSTPELKAWFDSIIELNEQSREMLGITDYYELPDNFYPNIRTETMEALLANPMSVINGSKFMESLVIQEDDTAFYQYNQHGEIKEVPKYWINPIEPDAKSYDILNSTIMFTKMALHYKYAKDYESVMMAYRATLANSIQEVNDLSGKSKWDYAADKITAKLAGSDTLKTFDNLIDYYIYGIGTQDRGKNFEIFGTEINSTKAVQAVLNKTRQMALGLNVVAGAAGGLAATLGMYVNSYKEGIYSRDQIAEARKLRVTDMKKSLGILAYLDGGMDTREQVLMSKNKSFVRKWISERMLYAPFRWGDESLGQTHVLAMSLNYGLNELNQIKRLDNLPEGTKSLHKLLKDFNPEDNKDFQFEGKTKEESEEIASRFRQMTRRALYNITGTVAEEDIFAAKLSLLGQVLGQFKNWMPGVVSERTGKYKVDDILDIHNVGRYRAAAAFMKTSDSEGIKKIMSNVGTNIAWGMRNLLWSVSSQTGNIAGEENVDFKRINLKRAYIKYQQLLLNNPDMVDKVSFQQFVDTYEGQLKALVIELRILLGFFLAAMVMGLAGDDDEPLYKENWAFRQLYKVSRKTLSEIMYFYDPTSLTNLFDSGIPAIKTITKAFNILTNGVDSTIDLFQEEDKKDKTPFGYYSLPFIINGWQGLRSTIEPYSQDKVNRYQ
jgi:hypothetical protein